MKRSNPIFGIKNFRSFGNEESNFEIAPITILTGCNSAGKSSLVKALLLLSEQRREPSMSCSCKDSFIAIDLYHKDLHISSKELNLGRYDKVVNNESEGNIVFSYTIWSNRLQDYVKVCNEFAAKSNDPLNNGYLKKITIKKLDDTIFFEQKSCLAECYSSEGTFYYPSADDNYDFESIKNNYELFTSAKLCSKLLDCCDFADKTHLKCDEETKQYIEVATDWAIKVAKNRLKNICSEYNISISFENIHNELKNEMDRLHICDDKNTRQWFKELAHWTTEEDDWKFAHRCAQMAHSMCKPKPRSRSFHR